PCPGSTGAPSCANRCKNKVPLSPVPNITLRPYKYRSTKNQTTVFFRNGPSYFSTHPLRGEPQEMDAPTFPAPFGKRQTQEVQGGREDGPQTILRYVEDRPHRPTP